LIIIIASLLEVLVIYWLGVQIDNSRLVGL